LVDLGYILVFLESCNSERRETREFDSVIVIIVKGLKHPTLNRNCVLNQFSVFIVFVHITLNQSIIRFCLTTGLRDITLKDPYPGLTIGIRAYRPTLGTVLVISLIQGRFLVDDYLKNSGNKERLFIEANLYNFEKDLI